MSKALKYIAFILLIGGFVTNNAWAYVADRLVGNECPDAFNVMPTKPKGTDANAPEQVKQAYQEVLNINKQALKMCKDACIQANPRLYCSDDDVINTLKKNGTYNDYLQLVEDFNKRTTFIGNYSAEKSCGYNYPYGCPKGKKCYKTKANISNIRGGMAASATNINTDGWDCIDEKEADVGERKQDHFNADSTVIREATADEDKTTTTTVSSTFSTALGTRSKLDEDGNFSLETTYAGGTLVNWGTFDVNGNKLEAPARTNKDCDIEADRQSYLGTCYSCMIVSAIIRTFLAAVNISMPLMQEAGATLLGLGMLLWLAVYVLQKLSSFVSLEPMKMLQDLFAFFFKCAIAIILITSGIKMIASLIVNPILSAGAEYGIAFIDTVTPKTVSVNGLTSQDSNIYQTVPGEILDKKVFDKIMEVSKKADAAVSINFVIGNAVMCHSTHAGAIVVAKKIQDIIGIEFYFPDVWLWVCGAAIWIFAFMVVMGVNFYLLDLSFKIGFALLAMPFTLGLWPFNKFKDKFTECLKMVVNAAGTFMFLGITTGMSIVLISAALGGTDELFEAIKNDNKVYISQKFGFTSGAFLLIIFAYAYSYNLISATVSKLTNKFFGSSISGAVGTPIHEGTTGAINTAKELGMAAGGRVVGWAKKGGKALAESVKESTSK